jgi:ABC-type transport system involved in cytochrome c biogenesis permease subunit
VLLVRRSAHRTLGAFLVPLATLLAAASVAAMAPPTAVNVLFKSRLFALHTLSLFLGYSAFSVSFCAGVMYLLLFDEIAHKKVGRMFARLPSLDDLDRLGQRTVVLGFLLLTAGIVFGMVWARREWGVAWVWESKNVWSLLTWTVYLGYLLTRRLAGWQGQRAAWLATIGFALTIFTWLGSSALASTGRHVF